MGKRFGRNQKRKMQENVNNLREALRMGAHLQQNTRQELVRAREALQVIYHEIGKNLNPYHPLLPKDVRKQWMITAKDLPFVQLPGDRGVYRTIEVLRRRFVTDEFRQRVAIRIIRGDTEVAYAIDMRALLVETFRAEYVEDLAREIADKLAAEVQKWAN